MARILSIDYGKKRTGLAVTDPLQIIATGLTTVETRVLIPFLKNYFRNESVDKIVLGFPVNLNGADTDATKLVRNFHAKFTRLFPNKEVILLDERFTSKIASQTILNSGLKKEARKNKALIDEVSATILLQDYLENVRISNGTNES